MPTLYNLNITIQDDDYELSTGLLAVLAPDGWEEVIKPNGETLFKLYNHNIDNLKSVKEAFESQIKNVVCDENCAQEEDWLASWKENFKPVVCGEHFVILPPWLIDQKSQFEERIPIIIEPKNAFGTGQHETTALCLTILSELYTKNKINSASKFLDLGTGSGILAIACAKLGLKGLAIDTDADAIANTHENSSLNRVKDKITPTLGSIETVRNQKFDLILANILAEPLINMAQDITNCLTKPAHLILSGLLGIQADKVSQAYQNLGLTSFSRIDSGEWSALYFDIK